jgi:protein lysine acetyltransferase
LSPGGAGATMPQMPQPTPTAPLRRILPCLELRPLRREDRDALEAAFYRLSDRSRRLRFHGPKPVLQARELGYLSEIDHVDHEAIVAVDRRSGEIVGEARYARYPGSDATADVAFVVADEWQRQGVGSRLGDAILRRAAENGISTLVASMLAENDAARALLKRLGFRAVGQDGAVVEFEREVAAAPAALAA